MSLAIFDTNKYINQSIAAIQDHMHQTKGKLYLQIQGTLLQEEFAKELLGNDLGESKKNIFKHFSEELEILIAINADLVIEKPLMSDEKIPFLDYIEFQLKKIENNFKVKPQVVIYNIQMENLYDMIFSFEKTLIKKGYKIREKYKIKGYPFNTEIVLSEEGFGNDDHIPIFKKLALISELYPTEITTTNGSFEIAMSQIYRDHEIDILSNFANFQTFPICTLSSQHLINQAWSQKYAHILISNDESTTLSTHNNEVFQILKNLFSTYLDPNHPISQYSTPLDLLINATLSAITNLDETTKRAKKWLHDHS